MKPVNNLLNQKFGRLIVLERAPDPKTRKNDTAAYWKCQCTCGNTSVIRGYSLTTGKTQSCGCLKLEAPHLLKYQDPKFSTEISAGKIIWSHRYREISFEDFYKLSQMNCYYCNYPPNLLKFARRKNIIKEENIPFIYNTLDRLNSNLGHTIDNVVSCCMMCNTAKLDRTLKEFKQYIYNIINNIKIDMDEYKKTSLFDIKNINNKQLLANIKSVHSLYNEGNLTLDQTFALTSMNCYYCGQIPINKRNVYGNYKFKKADMIVSPYIYNGLDRVDNSRGHDYDNVIPCCKYCNSAKRDSTLEEFYAWIERLKFVTF